MVHMVHVPHTHGRARLTSQIFQLLSFRHFAHKILIVNLISILFSPTRSYHLHLSYSTVENKFPHPKTTYTNSLIITYFPKTLKLPFQSKHNFLPNLSMPKTYDSNRKSIHVNSSQQHNHFTLIHQNQHFHL